MGVVRREGVGGDGGSGEEGGCGWWTLKLLSQKMPHILIQEVIAFLRNGERSELYLVSSVYVYNTYI